MNITWILGPGWLAAAAAHVGAAMLSALPLLAPPSDLARDQGAVAPAAPRFEEEHFSLELMPAAAGDDATSLLSAQHGTPAGWLVVRRHTSGDARQLEIEVRFLHQRSRAIHVEQLDGAARRLVWREIGPDATRTLTAQRDRAELSLREWVGRERVDSVLANSRNALFALELLEQLRAGQVPEAAEVFDPLSRSIERWFLRSELVPEAGTRRIEALRADGSLAGRWTFEGTSLAGFSWQRGGLLARRIDPQQFSRAWIDWETVENAGDRALSSVKSE